ncbi:hypothetical protein Tco_0140467 [Tanacetum coccineum]
MAVLESCPKHNMIAYLEKTDGNAEFHEIIDFLTRSSIHYALTYIIAKVAGKPVTISEASIKSDLLFDDADGIDSLNNQTIFDTIQLMGSKSTSWDQIPTNIATAVICLATNQKYNFSKLIFNGMMRHLDAKKKFVMYLRFISVFLANLLKYVSVPLDHFLINALTSKVLSFMVKKGKNFSGNVTPLFDSILVQPTEDEGEALERPSKSHIIPSPPHPSEDQLESQPYPSPRPSPSIPIPYSIPEGSDGNHGGKSSSDRSLSRNEDGLTLQSIYDLYGRKYAKSKPTTHKDKVFDDLDGFDGMDYMETEDAYNENRVSTEDKVCTDKPEVSTDKPKVSTDKLKVSTNQLNREIGWKWMNVLMKCVEIKDVEDADRPRPTSTRSVLTLKPLPKIHPKDKSKKVLEEEAKSEAESEGVNEAERKFAPAQKMNKKARQARIEVDSILAARLQEEERGKFTIKERDKLLHDTIAAQRRFLAQQRAAEVRSRPPIRTQLRNQMMTYLNHVEGKKHSDLKTNNF